MNGPKIMKLIRVTLQNMVKNMLNLYLELVRKLV